MKLKTLVLSSIALSTLTSLAFARGAGPHFLTKLDANADGSVTQMEFRAGATGRITAADTDGDGAASKEELKAYRKTAQVQHRAQAFAERDANKDGVLSQDEVSRMPQAIFQKLDADSNGTLSATEFAAAFTAGRPQGNRERSDSNDKSPKRGHRDAQAGGGEHAERGARAAAMLARVDTNSDGKVDVAEAQAIADLSFAKLDRNADGVLTAEELKSNGAHRRHGRRGHGHKAPAGTSAE